MLPMVAIAVLACVVGYYVKNKFFKDDEDKEEKEKSEQKKIEGQKFPNQPKANKPWLTAQGTLFFIVFDRLDGRSETSVNQSECKHQFEML